MTDEQLEAISKACAEATRGEWLRTTTPAPLRYGGPEGFIVLCDGPIAHVERMEDADFLTLAHRAVPALVDEVRRLRAEREAWAIEELHGPGRVAKVRAEAYEKAARLAERAHIGGSTQQFMHGYEVARKEIAAAIRALAKGEG